MKSSDFVLDFVYLLYYKCHEITRNRGVSCIDSSHWIKSKKATANPLTKKITNVFNTL